MWRCEPPEFQDERRVQCSPAESLFVVRILSPPTPPPNTHTHQQNMVNNSVVTPTDTLRLGCSCSVFQGLLLCILLTVLQPLHRPLLTHIMFTSPSPNITPQAFKAGARRRSSCADLTSQIKFNPTAACSCCSICLAHAEFPAGGPAFKDSLSSAGASAGSPVAQTLN